MNSLVFVTGNEKKRREAQAAFRLHDISLSFEKVTLDEIQHHDPLEVACRKARDVYDLLQKPLLINDTAWTIPALNGFPGVYMKDVAGWFTPEDFIALLAHHDDRRICVIETVIYKDKSTEQVFQKEFWGEVAQTPRGSGLSIECVAVFNGKTLGESNDAGALAFNPSEYIWNDVALWYKTRV